MDSAKPYKLTENQSSEICSHLHRNYITIIGIGDFGEAVLYKLIKYHKSGPDLNFLSTYIHISKSNYEDMDYQDGITAGVLGTPTFFLNGTKVEGSIPKEVFEQLIAL